MLDSVIVELTRSIQSVVTLLIGKFEQIFQETLRAAIESSIFCQFPLSLLSPPPPFLIRSALKQYKAGLLKRSLLYFGSLATYKGGVVARYFILCP